MFRTAGICLGLLMSAGCASTAPPGADAVAQLAPQGRLRAAINFGNPILANKDPASGAPSVYRSTLHGNWQPGWACHWN